MTVTRTHEVRVYRQNHSLTKHSMTLDEVEEFLTEARGAGFTGNDSVYANGDLLRSMTMSRMEQEHEHPRP